MKTFTILLASAALSIVASAATPADSNTAFASSGTSIANQPRTASYGQPEGNENANVQTASYGQPEGNENTNVQTASYGQPEGSENANVQTASYGQPEGNENANVQTA